MRPSDLTPPFRFTQRHVLLKDRVLYIPPHLPDYQEDAIPNWEGVFQHQGPLFIEYCSGHGHWVIEQAKRNPQQNWMAIEYRFDRVQRIWSKRENCGLNNLLIICGEAHDVSRRVLHEESVSGIFINFPDPWPKNRHAKHRLINGEFLNELARLLLPQAPLTLVTDDRLYANRFVQEVARTPHLDPTTPFPHYVTHWPNYGDSYFHALWKNQGREIYYLPYKKSP